MLKPRSFAFAFAILIIGFAGVLCAPFPLRFIPPTVSGLVSPAFANNLPNSTYAQLATAEVEEGVLTYRLTHLLPTSTEQGDVTVAFTANGSTSITVPPGTDINYSWTSNGATATSSYVLDSPDTCGNATVGPYPWVASTPSGSADAVVQDCQDGHMYGIMFTAISSAGARISKTIFITVSSSSGATSGANIAGVQGYDPVSGKYTDGIALVNTYLILYGVFAENGNVISIDGTALPAADVTYQSAGQINVFLADTAIGAHSVGVTDSLGSSTAAFTVESPQTSSGGGPSAPLSETTAIGPYFWGGSISGVPASGIMAAGDAIAKGLDASVIRIYMGAKSDMDYTGGSCIPNFTLTDLAKRSDFNAILSDPQFRTVVITAYDGVSFGDCWTKSYLDPAFYTPANIQKIENEYTDFADYLKQFNKSFIISNWEGDNDAYCGSIGAAAVSDGASCPNAPQNLAGLAAWFAARHAGIKAAGAANVFDAIEFNSVGILKDKGLPSLLYDVIPSEAADYYSYSSYESINVSPDRFSADVDAIRGLLPGGQLMIGEFGFKVGDFGNAAATALRLQETAQVIQDKSLPYGIVWNLLDNPVGFGLDNSAGTITPSGDVVKNLDAESNVALSAQAMSERQSNPSSPSTVRVTAASLNVRSAPNTSAALAGSQVLHAGDEFTATNEVTGESVNGNDLWWVSSAGNYVWSGGTAVE